MFLAIILIFFTSLWLGVFLCIERSNRRYFARRFNYCRKESALHLVTLMTSTYQLTYETAIPLITLSWSYWSYQTLYLLLVFVDPESQQYYYLPVGLKQSKFFALESYLRGATTSPPNFSCHMGPILSNGESYQSLINIDFK